MVWNGTECGKNNIMRISKKPSPVKIKINQIQLENVEFLNIWVEL